MTSPVPPEADTTRRLRRAAAGAAVLLLVLAVVAVFGPGHFRPEPGEEGGGLGLVVLWYIDLTLTAAIAFVLLRSVIKLAFERRSRTPGSRFKVRLVATNVSLALLPAALVFLIASDLLQRTVDRFFSPGFEQALSDARTLAERLTDREERRVAAAAVALATRVADGCLAEPSRERELGRLMEAPVVAGQIDVAALRARGGTRSIALSPGLEVADVPPFPEDLFGEPGRGPVTRIVVAPRGRFVLAAADAGDGAAAVAGVLLDADLDRAALGAVSAHQEYQRREQDRSDVKAASILLFLTITLLVLLAAVWVGLYVGRRLTTPIQALVESTRRVSAGDLSAQVVVPADDELRGLVESWNAMIGELRGNKEQLLQANAELTSANETLETGRRFVRAILESATTAIVAVGPDGTIQVANRSAAALVGEADGPKSLIGRRLEEFASTPGGSPLVDFLAAVKAGTLAEPVREFNLERDGETRTFEARLAPLRGNLAEDGLHGLVDDGGWVLAAEDVTPIVHAQRSAAWQEVARRMAHEVRNPLTPIKLSAERMQRKLDAGTEGLPEAIREGTATIVEHVGTLENLVDEFSRFARLPRFAPRPTDLEALVRRTVELYSASRPGVSVRSEIASLGAEVPVDPDGLRRVLVNLLENALEATPDGGVVTTRLASRPGGVRIEVEDSGAGIAPADRQRIFQPYFSTKGRGTGLGLAISRRIVTDHGGTIRVEDPPARGTRFVVELPVAAA